MRFRFYSVVLLALSFIFFVPTQAHAAPVAWNGKVIVVTENLDSSWPVSSAVNDVDYWMGSDMVMVSKCTLVNDCLEIKKGAVNGSPRGRFNGCKYIYKSLSDKNPRRHCTITIDTRDANSNKKFNAATKRWLLRHEIGHFAGLKHQSKCVSNMFDLVHCSNGKLAPNKWTTSEKKTMRSR